MKIMEAYDIVLKEVNELGKNMEVIINECKPTEKSRKENACQIPLDKWINVEFRTKNEKESVLVFDKVKSLLEFGISFDTGKGMGGINWEIDWSFKVIHDISEEIIDITKGLGNIN